jgi:hypothetical protein
VSQPDTREHVLPSEDVYLARRVSELPQPPAPSDQRICSKCRQAVWVADDWLHTLDRLQVVCVVCSPKYASRDT